MRGDAANRKAAVGARSAGEEAAEVHRLEVPVEGGGVGDRDGQVPADVREILAERRAIVRVEQEPEHPAEREGDVAPERDVAARFGLHANVARERAAGESTHLKVVRQVEARVGVHGAVAEVERRDELGEEQDDALQVRVERLGEIRERDLTLNVVGDRGVQVFSEAAVEADGSLGFDVPHDRCVGIGVLLHEQRVHVELGLNEANCAGLEEARLPELDAQALGGKIRVGQDRPVGPLDVAEPRRVEDEPRLELDAEVAQAPEKVVVLPADESVDVGLDRVELGSDAEAKVAELARLDLSDERHDGGRRIGERRRDVDGAEDLEIEQRLRRSRDLGARVLVALVDVDGAAQRLGVDEVRLRAAAVRIEAHEADRAEASLNAGGHREVVIDRVRAQVGACLGLDGGIGVPAIGEGARDVRLRFLVRVLVEARAARDRRVRRGANGLGVRDGEPVEPLDAHVAVEGRRALVDDDRDADVVRTVAPDAGGPSVRVEEAAATVVALDAREVALEHRRVVDRVVVDDAAEEPEELGAGGRREPIRDVVGVHPSCPADGHRVDRRAARGDRRARDRRGQREDRRRYERDASGPGGEQGGGGFAHRAGRAAIVRAKVRSACDSLWQSRACFLLHARGDGRVLPILRKRPARSPS